MTEEHLIIRLLQIFGSAIPISRIVHNTGGDEAKARYVLKKLMRQGSVVEIKPGVNHNGRHYKYALKNQESKFNQPPVVFPMGTNSKIIEKQFIFGDTHVT